LLIEPEHVRIVMDVLRGEILLVIRLKDASQEVDRLVKRIHGDFWR
jgi:hypothetical protein